MTDLTKVKEWLKDADAVIVTAGNGMAKEEGLDILSEENFDDEYGKVADKYDVHTIGDALDKKFDTWDEQWAFWSQLVNEYSLEYEPSETMLALKELLKDPVERFFLHSFAVLDDAARVIRLPDLFRRQVTDIGFSLFDKRS